MDVNPDEHRTHSDWFVVLYHPLPQGIHIDFVYLNALPYRSRIIDSCPGGQISQTLCPEEEIAFLSQGTH